MLHDTTKTISMIQLILIILKANAKNSENIIIGKFQPRDKNLSRGNSFIMIDVYFILLRRTIGTNTAQ